MIKPSLSVFHLALLSPTRRQLQHVTTTSTERDAQLAFVFNLRSEDVRRAISGSIDVILQSRNKPAVGLVPPPVVLSALSTVDPIWFHLKCLGPSCNNIQTLNITFSQCPSNLDYYGNPCSCCYALNNQYTTPPGVCYDEFLRNILNSLIYDNNSIKPDSDLTKPVKNNPYITKDNY